MNIIIIITLAFWNLLQLYYKVKKTRTPYVYVALFILHFLSFILYYYMNVDISRDSALFYENALNSTSILELGFLGSSFMSVLIYPFVKIGVSYFTLSFLFASISFYIFLRYFEFLLNLNSKNKSKMQFALILLLLTPSLHYWTGGLNKESLLIFFMGIIFFEIRKIKFLSMPLIISLVFISLIRPYLFFLILGSLGIHLLLSDEFSIRFKKNVILFLGIAILFSIPILSQFLGIELINLNFLNQKYESIIAYSDTHGSSSINLRDSNYLDRLFLVLFRPLFYDAKTFLQYLISFENLLFIILILKFSYDYFRKKVRLFVKKEAFIFVTGVFLILFYSIYMYNLGLASRMRSMFIPYFYIFIFMCYYRSKELYEE